VAAVALQGGWKRPHVIHSLQERPCRPRFAAQGKEVIGADARGGSEEEWPRNANNNR
jgi:hypothetical protein